MGKGKLAEYVIRLIKDENLRKKMGENGKRTVVENFIITVHLKNYLKTFLNLLG